jgi:hypothetical protein
MLSRATVGFWTPTNDTVTAIADALSAHWVAAKATARDQFWGKKQQNWLDSPRHALNHLTTSR